jgi:mRNA interferase MazF
MAGDLIRRGDIIAAVAPGDYGKPRPVLVIQSDLFSALPSFTVCPLTTHLRHDAPLLRLVIDPSPDNGLKQRSQIAIDKMTTLPRSRFGQTIGRAGDEVMLQVTRALAVFTGIA